MLAEASFPRGGTFKNVKLESEKETKDLVSFCILNHKNEKIHLNFIYQTEIWCQN